MAKQSTPTHAQPSQMEINPLLALLNAGQLEQTVAAAKKLLPRYPHAFICIMFWASPKMA